jgi:CubicO group peptidase (beta-lactamase class C family)
VYRAGSPSAAQQLALSTFFSYPIGARAIYSDIGLILLGLSIERLTRVSLDQAVRLRVSAPLGLMVCLEQSYD